MTSPEVYWIWLQLALGEASRELSRILEFFSSAHDFYSEGINGWRNLGIFSETRLHNLESTTLSEAEAIFKKSCDLGYDLITPEQSHYPSVLRQIVDPPAVLYCKGHLPDFDNKVSISVVGTRTASPYGLRVAHDISADLCRAGAIVVSGGALGIDISAHKGALSVNGVTVAVLGCGINYPYLMENSGIRSAIAIRGAVISEYPPSAPPLPHHFPVRNRIISGISHGTLVVEAAHKSGSLITASRALEQGKDIFAIPGDIAAITSRGTNELIQSGAKAVLSAEDILDEYRYVYPGRVSQGIMRPSEIHKKRNTISIEKQVNKKHKTVKAKQNKILNTEGFSDSAKAFYSALTSEPRHLDEISELADLTTSQALCAVTELELLGRITAHSGKRYSL